VPTMRRMMMTKAGYKVFCLVGPSGSGKDTLKNALKLPHIVSYRTREQREGEEEGIDGYFISKKEFFSMKEQGFWIAETEYAGNFYGITQGELLELEQSPLLYVVDWNGVETLRETFEKMEGYSQLQIVSIFINAPRFDLEKRMIRQGRNEKEIEARLLQHDLDYQVRKKCDYEIINENGKIDASVRQLYEIIFEEEFILPSL
jgi:guanylate kinase